MALIILASAIAGVLIAGVGLILGLWLASGEPKRIAASAQETLAGFFSPKQPKEAQDNTLKFSRRLTQAQFERQAEEAKLREMEEGRG